MNSTQFVFLRSMYAILTSRARHVYQALGDEGPSAVLFFLGSSGKLLACSGGDTVRASFVSYICSTTHTAVVLMLVVYL